MLKFTFIAVALLVFIDLHYAEGDPSAEASALADPLMIGHSSGGSSSNCKSGKNCKRKYGRGGKQKCHGSNCCQGNGNGYSNGNGRNGNGCQGNGCQGNNCPPFIPYPPMPPMMPPVTMAPATMAPATMAPATMAPATMAPATMATTMAPSSALVYTCPIDTSLIRVAGVNAIAGVLAGIGNATYDNIAVNITDPSGVITGICLYVPVCPTNSATVNLYALNSNSFATAVANNQIDSSQIVKNITDSNGNYIAICVSYTTCPNGTLLLNFNTVSLDSVGGILSYLGVDISNVAQGIYDVYGIIAAVCISLPTGALMSDGN